jgi:hypothetical protein
VSDCFCETPVTFQVNTTRRYDLWSAIRSAEPIVPPPAATRMTLVIPLLPPPDSLASEKSMISS